MSNHNSNISTPWNSSDNVQKAVDLTTPAKNRRNMSIKDLNFQIKKFMDLACRLFWNWPSKSTTQCLNFCEMWMSKCLQCVLMYYILYCCSALALLHLLNTHSLKWSTFFSLFFCIAWMYVFWSCWKAHVTLEQCIQFLLRTYLHLRSIEDTLCSLPWLIWLYSHQLSEVFYHVAFHTKITCSWHFKMKKQGWKCFSM